VLAFSIFVDKWHTSLYIDYMIFNWNSEKNKWLVSNRNISFEQIVVAIENGDFIGIMKHPNYNYPNQFMILVIINEYIYCVPTIINGNEYFLKTIYPSRKYTKRFLKNEA
jgi:hypothetical protein